MFCISSAQYNQTAEETDPCLAAAGSYPKSWQSPWLPALSLPPESASWSVWPVHFPASRSPSSKCFLSSDRINHPWGHTAVGPPSYQSALGGSRSHSAASQHQHHSQRGQLVSPDRRGRPLLRHQITGPAPFHNTALE